MNKEQAKDCISDMIPIIGSRYVELAELKRKRYGIILNAKNGGITESEQETVQHYNELINSYRKKIKKDKEEIHAYIDQIRWWKLF